VDRKADDVASWDGLRQIFFSVQSTPGPRKMVRFWVWKGSLAGGGTFSTENRPAVMLQCNTSDSGEGKTSLH